MEEKTANFLFSRIEDIGFELHPKPENFKLKAPSKEIRIGIFGKPDPNLETDEFVLDMKIVVEFVRENVERAPLLNYHFSSTFKFFTPLSGLVKSLDDEAFNFPENIMAAMVGTAYSTARGLLITKVGNSYLKEFMLPMVSVSGLMKQVFSSEVIPKEETTDKPPVVKRKKATQK